MTIPPFALLRERARVCIAYHNHFRGKFIFDATNKRDNMQTT